MAGTFHVVNEELMRWKRRQMQIEETLKRLQREEERLNRELAETERQLAYYTSLTGDMKRELGPPNLASMLNAFRKS